MDMKLVVIVALLLTVSCNGNEFRVGNCNCEDGKIITV